MANENSKTIGFRLDAEDSAHKITKVIGYKRKGFAVLTPYHRAKSGVLIKLPVDHGKAGVFNVPFGDCVTFTASNRVKLSYHPDGFVQFSGEVGGKIISGRDKKSGEPKGLGLMTKPLSDPIRSGPTFCVMVWGLEDFELLPEKQEVAALLFGPDDFYYRQCTPRTANAIMLEVFVFPARYWAATRRRGSDYVLSMALSGFEASYGVIDLKVIDLPDQEVLLAGFASRTWSGFPSTSGWQLSGPSDVGPDGKGHGLNAIYPAREFPAEGLPSLDRLDTSP